MTRSAASPTLPPTGWWTPANVIHVACRADLAPFLQLHSGSAVPDQSADGQPLQGMAHRARLTTHPGRCGSGTGLVPGPVRFLIGPSHTAHAPQALGKMVGPASPRRTISVGCGTWQGPSDAELDALVERAIVDAYDEYEQLASFHVVIEEHLAVPFRTTVLGVEVTVTKIDLLSGGVVAAICSRGKHRQAIGILDLPLPTPPPAGAEWIDAYRRWAT